MAVYFIRAGEDGPVKIGTALDPLDRLKQFQTGNHLMLRLIRKIDGWSKAEEQIHARYATLRVRGEWFRFCPTMLTEVFDLDLSPDEPMSRPVCPIVERAAKAAGGYSKLARHLGISRASIPQWRHGVPTQHIRDVAELTGMSIDELLPQ